MKYSIVLFFVIVSSNFSFGQAFLSNARKVKFRGSMYQARLTKKSETTAQVQSDTTGKMSDSITKAELDSVNKAHSNIHLIGNLGSSALNLDNLQKAFGTLAVGFDVRLNPYHIIQDTSSWRRLWLKKRYTADHIYAIFNTKTITTGDSASIHKQLLFPEISKRVFVLGYTKEFIQDTSKSFEFLQKVASTNTRIPRETIVLTILA